MTPHDDDTEPNKARPSQPCRRRRLSLLLRRLLRQALLGAAGAAGAGLVTWLPFWLQSR